MRVVPAAKDPAVLSYLEMRSAVGWIALGLPIVLITVWKLLPGDHPLPTSISGYYYTGMRNLFEGSLCAIAMFNLLCRGYDWQDELAGRASALFAFGVAFFPTTPPWSPSPRQEFVGTVHQYVADLLFLTLAVMVLVLFRTTAQDRAMTCGKRRRNGWYLGCGLTMVACGIGDFVYDTLFHWTYLVGQLGARFVFEAVALLAFGIAWLVKGETFRFLRDAPPPAPGAAVGG
jgi:hypothetical protein